MGRVLFGISVALACVVVFGATVAPAQAGSPQIGFAHAKKELRKYAGFTCPTTECAYRIRACRQPSPLRVECRSETLEPWVEIRRGKQIVLWKEFCSWTGLATPHKGSTVKLQLSAKHYGCRRLKPNKGWPTKAN